MFVDRDPQTNAITAIYAVQQREGQEQLSDVSPALLPFMKAAIGPSTLASLQALSLPPPQLVTAGQLIRALDDLQLLDLVDQAVAKADALTQRLWARAPYFPRNDPLVAAIARALGKSDDELDDIFRLAGSK